eukprot:TRINITY_DN4015_c0_g1_i1.p1 TRINITY_DN4015_c0_g1~~TRINITY_DN4015_c0_g1_i1.p1  ORF type:complete len:1205 (+),score=356.52 TRINITY_DN4015_c0_g1_i1:96-3710(+)
MAVPVDRESFALSMEMTEESFMDRESIGADEPEGGDAVSSVGAPPVKRPVKIPIVAVIIAAMIISCGASVVGGLVMYFESLKSLEKTVQETSDAELVGLANEIENVVNGAYADADAMVNILYSTTAITGTNETQWADTVRNTAWGIIRAKPTMYSIGVVLIPRDGAENDACYLGVWSDPLRDGGVDILMGMRHRPHVWFDSTDGRYRSINVTWDEARQGWNVTAPSYSLSNATGEVTKYRYSWNTGTYLNDAHLGTFDPDRDEMLVPEHGSKFTSPTDDGRAHRVLGMRHRDAEAWYSTDNTLYAYAGWDVAYAAPKAPHPWSNFKAINAFSLYRFESWEPPLKEYRLKKGADTTIVVVNADTDDVYASTTNIAMLDQYCFDNWDGIGHSPSNCQTKVQDLGSAVMDSWAHISKSDADFAVANAGGEQHFIRKMKLFDDKPITMLWIRPTSSVQSQVNAALYLLIIFTMIVFVFDFSVGLIEMALVAWPLRKISKAVKSVGKMEVTEAEETLAPLTQRAVMIGEVDALLTGLTQTITNLVEYRSYLPEASLQNTEVVVEAPTGEIAIAFSDIVGSTPLWENAPEDMAIGLDIHNKVLRAALRAHNGYEVKTIGDAFMVAFQNPQDAYEYGMKVQADLVQQSWPADLCVFPNTKCEDGENKQLMFAGIRVRMGIHYGKVEQEVNPLTGRSDYRGATVNKAARIEPQALHGMTAFSEEMKNAINATCPVSMLGSRELKGIGTVKLFYSNAKSLSSREKRFKEWAEVIDGGGNPYANNVRRILSGGGSLRSGNKSGGANSKESTVVFRKERVAKNTAGHLNLNLKKEFGAICNLQLDTVTDASLQGSSSQDEIRVMLRIVNMCLQMALEAGSMTEGKVESCIGSQAVMSWGLSSRVSGVAKQCLRFIGQMYKRRSGHVTCGAVIGPFLHGNVGTSARRYHTVLGVGYIYAQMLPALCRQHATPHLAVMAGGLPPEIGHACVPIDIMNGDQDYGPYVVLERPVPKECAQLEMSWDDHDAADVLNPVAQFRSQLLEAAHNGVTLSAGAADIPGLPEELIATVGLFRERGEQLVSGAKLAGEQQAHDAVRLDSMNGMNGDTPSSALEAQRADPLSPLDIGFDKKASAQRMLDAMDAKTNKTGTSYQGSSMLGGAGFHSTSDLTLSLLRGRSFASQSSSKYLLRGAGSPALPASAPLGLISPRQVEPTHGA